MLRKSLIILLLGLILIAGLIPAYAQDHGSTPFAIEDMSPLDDMAGNVGAIIEHDSTFHMFHNVYAAFPSEVEIHYSTSDDGMTWTQQSVEPLLNTNDIDYTSYTVFVSDVLVVDDGTWVMYFTTWANDEAFASTSIGRATTSDPLGTWQVDTEPILTPSTNSAAWDSQQVGMPSVVSADDEYVMYYTGASADNALMIGQASSSDGMAWTKYDDPATTSDLYAESDPIIENLGNPNFDIRFQDVWNPPVVQTDEGWIMIFKSGQEYYEVGGGMVRYAVSNNGMNWIPDLANQAINFREAESSAIWFTELIYYEGAYHLYLEVEKDNASQILIATADSLSLPE